MYIHYLTLKRLQIPSTEIVVCIVSLFVTGYRLLNMFEKQ